MTINLVCITHNKHLFLRDFVRSYLDCAHPSTRLLIGAQGCTDDTANFLIQTKLPVTRQVVVFFYPENIGLNRYDDLIQGGDNLFHFQPDDILVDVDDDSILFSGFEDLFAQTLNDPTFGWVGLQPSETTILRRPGGQEWNVGNLRVVEAAVGGGLAATRFEMWRRLGGFGIGGTKFDLEDARFQRKCLAANLKCGIIEGFTYEHHGSWDWHIRYGTWHQRMDSLFECMRAGILDEHTYRANLMEFAALVETPDATQNADLRDESQRERDEDRGTSLPGNT